MLKTSIILLTSIGYPQIIFESTNFANRYFIL